MPRRYRPPTRRRKSKRGPLHSEGAFPAEEATAAPAPERPRPEPTPSARKESAGHERHVAQDYSYVVGEIRQIAIIAGLILLGLLITAILR